LPETTKVLFFLACAVFTILGGALVPFSWLTWSWSRGLLPELITDTRWGRGAWRGVVIVLLLVLGYGTVFLGWD
jgi:hypothetical protein